VGQDLELVKLFEEARQQLHFAIPEEARNRSTNQKNWIVRPWKRSSIASTVETKERSRALGALLDRLTLLVGFVSASDTPARHGLGPSLKTTLNDIGQLLADDNGRRLDVNAAWELAHELDRFVLEIADDSFLLMKIAEELRIDQIGHTRGRWSDLFEPAALTTLYNHLQGKQASGANTSDASASLLVRRQAIEVLVRLYQERSSQGRHRRAREALKARQLRWIGAALATLVATFTAVVIYGEVAPPLNVALALVAGMIGSGISGLRRLRDELLLIDELRAFVMAFTAQAVVGAALGLFALFLATVGLLPAFQADRSGVGPATVAVYAFVAGYSEPFVIGAIHRLAGSGMRVDTKSSS
jgi:hypothetical protein